MNVTEAFKSGRLSGGRDRSGERRFIVTDVVLSDGDPSADPPVPPVTEADIVAAIEAEAPATFDGMASRTIRVEQLSNSIWSATVNYTPSERIPPSGYEGFLTTFQTGGASENVQLALSQASASLVDGLPAPDFGNYINVDSSGQPAGVDIVVPKFEWAETHYLANDQVPGANNSWLVAAHNATGKVNADIFRNFAARSVLFLGANGAKRPEEDDWEVTFQFAAAPTTSISLPRYEISGEPKLDSDGNQELTQITKEGHQYIWFYSRQYVDDQSSAEVSRAESVFLSTVYEAVDFSTIIPSQ